MTRASQTAAQAPEHRPGTVADDPAVSAADAWKGVAAAAELAPLILPPPAESDSTAPVHRFFSAARLAFVAA